MLLTYSSSHVRDTQVPSLRDIFFLPTSRTTDGAEQLRQSNTRCPYKKPSGVGDLAHDSTPSISEDNKIDRDTPKLILDNLWFRKIIKIEG